jgi:predicted nucleic acid-binding protein
MIVDSNILIDVFNPQSNSAEQVTRSFATLSVTRQAMINAVIFAEVGSRFRTHDEARHRIEALGLAIAPLSTEDAFRAGQAFREYRRRGAPRQAILPDFLIGAQASVRGWPILTRDRKRFESYFPDVELIDPMDENHD